MKIWTILIPVLFVSIVSEGQTSFTASANRQNVSLDQTFQLSFVLKNAKADQLIPPSFEGFHVVNGPFKSQSTQMINFDVTTSITWTYNLKPLSEGTLIINSARVIADKKELSSNKVTIQVGPPSKNDPGASGGQNRSQASESSSIKENLFLKQIIDRRSVYTGEQVTVAYKLYTALTLVNITPTKNPSYEGFWTEEIELDKAQQREYEVIGNKRFEVITLKKDAVFPQRAGDLILTPLELNAVVRVQTSGGQPRSMFEEMFGSYRVRDIPVEISSNSTEINVKQLPPNPPKGFDGAVGKFRLETGIGTLETSTDNPITISVKISGQGNIKMIDRPSIQLPSNFDMFDPKVKEYVSKKSNKVNGYKSYDFLVIPRAPGEYKLPSISFTYFDPEREQYITDESGEYVIAVEGEASTERGVSSGISKEEIELLGSDIRFIKQYAVLSNGNNKFIGAIPYYTLCFSPFLLLTALVIIRKKRSQADKEVLRSKTAAKAARKRLSKARKLLQKGESKEFYDEIEKSVWKYFADKFKLDAAQLSREYINEKLISLGVPEELRHSLNHIFDTCEMHLYATAQTAGREKEIMEKTTTVITKLDKVI